MKISQYCLGDEVIKIFCAFLGLMYHFHLSGYRFAKVLRFSNLIKISVSVLYTIELQETPVHLFYMYFLTSPPSRLPVGKSVRQRLNWEFQELWKLRFWQIDNKEDEREDNGKKKLSPSASIFLAALTMRVFITDTIENIVNKLM
jgi:hypothetical protein